MDGIERVRVVELDPFGVSRRIVEARDDEIPGGEVEERLSVPLRLFTLFRVMDRLAEPPCAMVVEDGRAKMLKSGVAMDEPLT